MKLHRLRAARRLLLALAALATPVLSGPTQSTPLVVPHEDSVGETPIAAKGETRLRKLHLVRPDLIPYPIAFEVYC